MEQTVQAAVQQASGAGQWSWLQLTAALVAAFGTLVSLTTLFLTVCFRRRDNQTRLGITFWVDRTGSESHTRAETAFLVFRVDNNSKVPVYISRGWLEYGNDQQLRLVVTGGGGAFGVGTYRRRNRYQLPPRLPFAFEHSMVELAKCLLDQGMNIRSG